MLKLIKKYQLFESDYANKNIIILYGKSLSSAMDHDVIQKVKSLYPYYATTLDDIVMALDSESNRAHDYTHITFNIGSRQLFSFDVTEPQYEDYPPITRIIHIDQIHEALHKPPKSWTWGGALDTISDIAFKVKPIGEIILFGILIKILAKSAVKKIEEKE